MRERTKRSLERDALRRIVIHVFRGDDVIGRTLVFDPLIEGREDIVSGIGGVRPVDPLTERIWTGSATAVSHAAVIVPTEFLPGKMFGSGSMQPIDYCVAMADGHIAPPSNLDLATIQHQEMAMTFRYHLPQYLTRRAADWKALGFNETLVDFVELNRRSKFWGDDQRAAFRNWEEVGDPCNPLNGRQGVNERIMLRELLRRADMMVILENRLDALVRLHTPWPPGLIGQLTNTTSRAIYALSP